MTETSGHSADNPPHHYCGVCAKQLRYSPRTPWYICGQCLEKAVDARGNAIMFIGMGAEWCYRDGYGPDAHDNKAINVICLIAQRPVMVHEARQGGPVGEIIHPDHAHAISALAATGSAHWSERGLVDLTRAGELDAIIAERLVKPGRKVSY
ncbi:MAG: hypothetical protein WBO55_02760 [Rhizobiaceae bacterium]